MFTGIVEDRGRVRATGGRLLVDAGTAADGTEPGASVAVNGVCLTVVDRQGTSLSFDLHPETVARSTLGELRPGDEVNLERAVTLATRLGGHLVQGHVDAVATVDAVEEGPDGARMRIRLDEELRRYIVEKGSVALDGVSLTVAGVDGATFEVAVIPHTRAVTTLGRRGPGDRLNVEVDVIAKYVDALGGRR